MDRRKKTPLFLPGSSESDNSGEDTGLITLNSSYYSIHLGSPILLSSPTRYTSPVSTDVDEDWQNETPDTSYLENENSFYYSQSFAIFTKFKVEIEKKIFELLDDSDLISLAQADAQRNRTALEVLFERHDIDYKGDLVLHLPPTYVVAAFNLAFWLDSLESLTYYLDPNVDQIFRQLTGLIFRLKNFRRLPELNVSLKFLDIWKEMGADLDLHVKDCDKEWRDLLHSFLEVVGSSPTRMNLFFMGGDELTQVIDLRPLRLFRGVGTWPVLHRRRKVPTPGQMPQPKENPYREREMIATNVDGLVMIRNDLDNLDCLYQRSPYQNWQNALDTDSGLPGPEELIIHSSLLSHLFFLSTTFGFVCTSSVDNLKNLEFANVKTEERIWRLFLTNAHFRRLETFTYTQVTDNITVNNPVLTIKILVNFLSRHPTIRKLNLYGVLKDKERLPYITQPLLPLLASVKGPPHFISWLLTDANHSCHDLEKVIIASEHQILSNIPLEDQVHDYEPFDEAIWKVSLLNQSLQLGFNWNVNTGLWEWIQLHLILGGDSFIYKLNKVESVVLKCGEDIYINYDKLTMLFGFLQLFPGLKEVEISLKNYGPEMIEVEELFTAFQTWMPNVSKLVVNGCVIY